MDKPVASVLYRDPISKRILVVYNPGPSGFGLPGGEIEDGEQAADAAARELREETGLTAKAMRRLYQSSSNGRVVTVFEACAVEGELAWAEEGCPTAWMTDEELRRDSAYPDFYAAMLDASVIGLDPLATLDYVDPSFGG